MAKFQINISYEGQIRQKRTKGSEISRCSDFKTVIDTDLIIGMNQQNFTEENL